MEGDPELSAMMKVYVSSVRKRASKVKEIEYQVRSGRIRLQRNIVRRNHQKSKEKKDFFTTVRMSDTCHGTRCTKK